MTISPQHRQILTRAAQGYSNLEIARELGLTLRQVKGRFQEIFWRYGVRTRTAAVVKAWRCGDIPPTVRREAVA